jgi:hypothetical protein
MPDTFNSMPSTDGTQGLTNSKFFKVGWDSSVPDGETASIKFWNVIDKKLQQCQEWFLGVDVGASPRFPLPITVIVWDSSRIGGYAAFTHDAVGLTPRIAIQPAASSARDSDNNRLLFLLMSEQSEIFMDVQDTGWYGGTATQDIIKKRAEGSIGEGLSHCCADEFAKLQGFASGDTLSDSWMSSGRDLSALSNTNFFTDEGPESALALLFIYYLHTQMDFTTEDIIEAGDKDPAHANIIAKLSLVNVYQNLTADNDDPTALFNSLIERPFSQPQTIGGSHDHNNPFPLINIDISSG